MLYEYGIRSTYLQGIKDQSMKTHEYTSSSELLSFRVSLPPKKHRIQGLNVTILYRSSSYEEDRNMFPLLTKISNRTKGLTWVYNPVVFCKPGVDEDVVWLSYWPIRNIFDTGDEVHVNILLDNGLMVTGCGASLVYVDVEKEEKCERMNREEVIGGDLFEFEVTKGVYYISRHDSPSMVKWLFGDNIQYTYSRRWRISRQCASSVSAYQQLNTLRNDKGRKIVVEVGVSFNRESETDKIEKAVSSIVGVESVSTHKEIGRLIVRGCFDPSAVAKCVGEFEKMVQVLGYKRI